MFRRINLLKGLEAMDREFMNVANFLLSETPGNQWLALRNILSEEKILLNGWSDEEAYFVEAQLPGLSEEAIDISIRGKELAIRATIDEDTTEEKNYIIKERPAGSVERIITLTDDMDATKIEATYVNGILKIKLPKVESAKVRKINVTTR